MKTKEGSALRKRGRPRRRRKEIKLPKDTIMSWPGKVKVFDRFMEGGPGRPSTLLLMVLFGSGLGYIGILLMDRRGVDSPGPAIIFIAFFWLLFVVFWVLIKGVLRSRDVVFAISERGVAILPSPKQMRMEQRLGLLSHIVFLLTYKGTRWTAWRPFTPWKAIRRVDTDMRNGHLLIRGGAWDIRLVCSGEQFDRVRELVFEKTNAATRKCTFS